MASYDLEALEEFERKCREMECSERRMEQLNTAATFIHKSYDELISSEHKSSADDNPSKHSTQMSGSSNEKHRLETLGDVKNFSLNKNEGTESLDEVLQMFRRDVVKTSLNLLDGSFFAVVGNSTHLISAIGASLTAYFPIPSVIYEKVPGACEVDLAVINWMCSIVGFKAGSCGYLTTGCSAATVHGFMVARDDHLRSPQLYSRCVVYMSELCHRANRVSLNVVGLSTCHVRKVKVNDNFQMDDKQLQEVIKEDFEAGLIPFMVVGTAGTTDAGSIDPLTSIAVICKQYQLWFHVDAAFGGVCMMSPTVKERMQGIELADSIALDFHKLFFQPLSVGAILLSDGAKLKKCMSTTEPHYLQATNSKYSPKDYTFELTRPMRGLSLWFSVKYLGEEFFRDVINEKLCLIGYLVEQLNQIPFTTVCNKPELTVVLFRYEPPNRDGREVNTELGRLLENSSNMVYEFHEINGILYQRVCIAAFRTHISEINALLNTIKKGIETLG